MRWRRWLVDVPVGITEVGFVWYRMYLLCLCAIAALTVPIMVATMLVLWYVFRMRWGW